MKVLFEEYGRMVLSIVCAMMTIVFLALFMTALGEVNNNHLSNAVGAETTIVDRATSSQETTIEGDISPE